METTKKCFFRLIYMVAVTATKNQGFLTDLFIVVAVTVFQSFNYSGGQNVRKENSFTFKSPRDRYIQITTTILVIHARQLYSTMINGQPKSITMAGKHKAIFHIFTKAGLHQSLSALVFANVVEAFSQKFHMVVLGSSYMPINWS